MVMLALDFVTEVMELRGGAAHPDFGLAKDRDDLQRRPSFSVPALSPCLQPPLEIKPPFIFTTRFITNQHIIPSLARQ